MRTGRSTPIAGVLGFCLLAVGLPRLGGLRSPRPAGALIPIGLPPPPRTPSEAARRTALRHFVRAQQAVNQQRYDLEAWDPAVFSDLDPEAWRLQLMARDGSGELRRALDAARQAAALARTPQEAYAAALLRADLEADAGHLDVAISQALWLMARQPHNPLSVMTLRRATRSHWREASIRRAAAGRNGGPPSAGGR